MTAYSSGRILDDSAAARLLHGLPTQAKGATMAEQLSRSERPRSARQQHTDARNLGARRSWASNGAHWAVTARLLLTTPRGFPDELLGFVALYLCVKTSAFLVNGRFHVPADSEAASYCPFHGSELTALCDRLERIRDGVLHHADRFGEDGGINLQFLPDVTITVTRIKQGQRTVDEMTRLTAIALLDRLEPWLLGQAERLQEPPPPDLGAKIEAWARRASGSNGR